jgi:lipoprotein signal peptidase
MRQVGIKTIGGFFLGCVAVDRLFKYIARTSPRVSERFWFGEAPRINSEAALSIPVGSLYLTVFLVIVWFVLVFLWIKNKQTRWAIVLFGILIAAASNVWDRIFYGGVVDYLPFFGISIMNISDIVISLGAIVLVVVFWRNNREVL